MTRKNAKSKKTRRLQVFDKGTPLTRTDRYSQKTLRIVAAPIGKYQFLAYCVGLFTIGVATFIARITIGTDLANLVSNLLFAALALVVFVSVTARVNVVCLTPEQNISPEHKISKALNADNQNIVLQSKLRAISDDRVSRGLGRNQRLSPITLILPRVVELGAPGLVCKCPTRKRSVHKAVDDNCVCLSCGLPRVLNFGLLELEAYGFSQFSDETRAVVMDVAQSASIFFTYRDSGDIDGVTKKLWETSKNQTLAQDIMFGHPDIAESVYSCARELSFLSRMIGHKWDNNTGNLPDCYFLCSELSRDRIVAMFYNELTILLELAQKCEEVLKRGEILRNTFNHM